MQYIQNFYNTNLYLKVEESEIENKKTSTLTIDLSQTGLGLVFKDYQELVMKNLWETGTGQSSRDAWVKANKGMRDNKDTRVSISRASIINFMNRMVDEGVLGYHEITGKGGHRRIYKAKTDEKGFWAYVTQLANEKLVTAAFTVSK